jgi:hypothetical protein
MKTIQFITQKNISALIGLAMGLLVLMSANANAAGIDNGKEKKAPVTEEVKLEAELEKLAQSILDEMKAKCPHIKLVKVYDKDNNLVYEGEQDCKFVITDPELRRLIKKSDFLVEYNNTAYYVLGL